MLLMLARIVRQQKDSNSKVEHARGPAAIGGGCLLLGAIGSRTSKGRLRCEAGAASVFIAVAPDIRHRPAERSFRAVVVRRRRYLCTH